MLDRWLMYGLLVLLYSEVFLSSFVGQTLAMFLVAVPLSVAMYRTVVMRLCLSGAYRSAASMLLSRSVDARWHAALFGVFLLTFFFSFARAAQVGTFGLGIAAYQMVKWLSVLTILFVHALGGERRGEPAPILRGVAIAFAVYAVVSVVLYLGQVQNEALNAWYITQNEKAVMFALVGLDVDRVALVLSNGIEPSGIQVAPGVALGAALAVVGLDRRAARWGLVLALSSAFCVLVTDARGGMLGALAGVAAVLAPRALKQRAKWIAVAIPVLPVLMMMGLSALGNEAWLQSLERPGGRVGTLSGRPLIWGSILLFLANFDLTHLFGYGATGQIGSGVSTRYAILFSRQFAAPAGAGAHNTMLQAVLDVGYIGAALQLMLYWQLFRTFARLGEDSGPGGRWAVLGLGATVCLAFLGLTAETLSFTRPNTLVLFLALNMHCLFRPRLARIEDTASRTPVEVGEGR